MCNAGFCANDRLVKHLEHVLFDSLPIEARKPARKRPNEFFSSLDFKNPVEEIRFHNTVNAALVELVS